MFLRKLFGKKIDTDLQRRIATANVLSADRSKRSALVNRRIEKKYATLLNTHSIYSYVGLGQKCAVTVFFKTESDKRNFLGSDLHKQFETDILDWMQSNKLENEHPFECKFEYDSDENVQKNWGGSYFKRLR